MKIVINYDLIKEIQNAKEPYTLVKDIKNRPYFFVGTCTLCTSIELILFNEPLPVAILNSVNIHAGILFGSYIVYRLDGDIYAKKAYQRLNYLVSLLHDLNIDTTCDLLLESVQYQKNYKINLNENKLPYMLEKKYILVPTYDSLGEIQSSFILQEHVVGSKIYVLSVSSPTKEYRFAYSNS